jgi:hypothetical protein
VIYIIFNQYCYSSWVVYVLPVIFIYSVSCYFESFGILKCVSVILAMSILCRDRNSTKVDLLDFSPFAFHLTNIISLSWLCSFWVVDNLLGLVDILLVIDVIMFRMIVWTLCSMFSMDSDIVFWWCSFRKSWSISLLLLLFFVKIFSVSVLVISVYDFFCLDFFVYWLYRLHLGVWLLTEFYLWLFFFFFWYIFVIYTIFIISWMGLIAVYAFE